MSKFTITEEERRRILNLHEKRSKNHYLTEKTNIPMTGDTGCPCYDGTTSPICCKTNVIKAQAKVLEDQENELKRKAVEEDKLKRIAEINQEIKDLTNQVIKNPPSDEFSKNLILKRVEQLELDLKKEKGIEEKPNQEPIKRTADQTVMSWIGAASGLLALINSALSSFRKPN